MINIKPVVGPSLISLYNLYPSATVDRAAGAGCLDRPDHAQIMERLAGTHAAAEPAGATKIGPLCRTGRKLVGSQMFTVFGLAMLLVYPGARWTI